MTICIAAQITWNYAGKDEVPQLGRGILTLSDRMITAGDVQYEPHLVKSGRITPYVMVLCAGQLPLHSQALLATHGQVRGDPKTSPLTVANIYAQAVQAIRLRQAENEFLAPVGLTVETFLAQQNELSPGFVDGLRTQLQGFVGPDSGAIVVGTEGVVAHIFEINKFGDIHCYDDVGFSAIGSGAWHAKSQLMQFGYSNQFWLPAALAATYAAKRAAEVAPGVGKTATDILVALKDGIMPLDEATTKKMETLYKEYEQKRTNWQSDAVEELRKFIGERASSSGTGQPTGSTGSQETG